MCKSKDGNKLNNRVDNLEICTFKENSIHAVCLGKSSAKLSSSEVVAIKHINANNRGEIDYLADIFEVSFATIYDILKGRTWKHLEYKLVDD